VATDTGQALGDIQFEVRHMAAEGDLVFTHFEFVATHSGQYQVVKHLKDLEPVGAEERVSGIALYRLEGGKIVEGWYYHNILEYAQQQKASASAGQTGG
jgi:predicted ester cyclase